MNNKESDNLIEPIKIQGRYYVKPSANYGVRFAIFEISQWLRNNLHHLSDPNSPYNDIDEFVSLFEKEFNLKDL